MRRVLERGRAGRSGASGRRVAAAGCAFLLAGLIAGGGPAPAQTAPCGAGGQVVMVLRTGIARSVRALRPCPRPLLPGLRPKGPQRPGDTERPEGTKRADKGTPPRPGPRPEPRPVRSAVAPARDMRVGSDAPHGASGETVRPHGKGAMAARRAATASRPPAPPPRSVNRSSRQVAKARPPKARLGLPPVSPRALPPLSAEGGDARPLLEGDGAPTAAFGPDGMLHLSLALDRPVPWRADALVAPPRLVLDLALGDLPASDAQGFARRLSALLPGELRFGHLVGPWWRLVILPGRPFRLESGGMRTEAGIARLRLTFRPGLPPGRPTALTLPAGLPPLGESTSRQADGRLKVAIDPGHGGVDPGAEHGGLREADITLALARALAEALRRRDVGVVLTRDDDRFVPLERRMSIARAAGADVLVSLHADALASGQARGVSIHTFSADASDEAAKALIARHARNDILAGLDLQGVDDALTSVLTDLAMRETLPRSEALADRMVAELARAGIRLLSRPRIRGAYAVLKSPDIPSVLVEAGFLSNRGDRRNLADPGWRRNLAEILARAVTLWALEDAGRAAFGGGRPRP